MMDHADLIEPFDRLVGDICPPTAVRDVEAGGDWRPMWSAFAESGFLDALLPETAGGFGLTLVDVAPLMEILGGAAVPLAVGETMISRALLTQAGHAAPEGPIVMATGAGPVPLGRIATHALVSINGPAVPLACEAEHTEGSTNLDRRLPTGPDDARETLLRTAAVLRSLLIAGAASRVLDMTIAYTLERAQFGKAIAKQQAIQQQLSVMAELVVATRLAARAGCRSGLVPSLAEAATAKHFASDAATKIANMAHAIHGAIGISAEHDLQLLTRRLHGWRLADGSEAYWAGVLGEMRLRRPTVSSVDFVRQPT